MSKLALGRRLMVKFRPFYKTKKSPSFNLIRLHLQKKDIFEVKSSLFHHKLKSKQAGNSDKTMRSSRSTAPISNT